MFRYGRIQLDDDDEGPEYTIAEWFGMLFVGSTGSTPVFWGVARPLNHTFNLLSGGKPISHETQNTVTAFTIYRLGIHMWVIMTLPGLALGYLIHKRHLLSRVSSIFASSLGARTHSWPGKLIDAVAIIGTVVGIVVPMGMGAL